MSLLASIATRVQLSGQCRIYRDADDPDATRVTIRDAYGNEVDLTQALAEMAEALGYGLSITVERL